MYFEWFSLEFNAAGQVTLGDEGEENVHTCIACHMYCVRVIYVYKCNEMKNILS